MSENIVQDAVQKSRIHPGVKISLAILAVLFWVSCLQLVPNDHLLSLRIDPDRYVYHLNDVINLTIKLMNTSERTLLVTDYLVYDLPDLPPPLRTLSYEIVGPDGEKLKNIGLAINKRSMRVTNFVLLNPGESVDRMEAPTWWFHFDQIGDYSIKACYENTIDPGWFAQIESSGVSDYDLRNAWKGIICSNETNIRVEP